MQILLMNACLTGTSVAVPHSPINSYCWKTGALSSFSIHLHFPINYWVVPIFYSNFPQIEREFMLSQYISCVGTRLLGDHKNIPPYYP